MTAAELVFKISQQGADELAKVRTAVIGIGEGTRLAGAQLKTFDNTLSELVNSGKTFKQALEEMARSNGVLSAAIRQTAQDMLTQMRAAEGDAEALRKLAGAHQQVVSGAQAAGGAIRLAYGESSIRAVEQFMSKVLGLGPILQSAFGIIGGIAFAEMLVHIGEKVVELAQKWDPVIQAEKRAKESADDYGKSVDAIKAKLESLDSKSLARAIGKPASSIRSADQIERDSGNLETILRGEQTRLGQANRELASAQSRFRSDPFQSNDPVKIAQANVNQLQDSVSDLMNRLAVLHREAGEQIASAGDAQNAENKKAERPDDQLKKRQAQETLKLRQEILELQAKELTGLAKINAERDAEIAKLKAQNLLTATNLDLITQKYAIEQKDALKAALDAAHANVVRMSSAAVSSDDRANLTADSFSSREAIRKLRQGITDDQHGLVSDLGVLADDRASQVAGVQRALGVQIHANESGNARGSAGAAGSDYNARLAAAQQIFTIETSQLDLIDDKDKREKALADARKKYAEEVFTAEASYQEQLQTIRERDLQKAHSEAGQLFDALTNRQGAGFGLTQLARQSGTDFTKQVFSNATAPILQGVGHALGGATGGFNPGGIFNGTMLDPKNQGPEAHAADTAKNTANTVAELKGLRSQLSGDPAAQPGGSGASGTGSGGGIPFLGNGSTIHGFSMSSLFSGGTSGMMGSFGSGITSALKGFGLTALLDSGESMSSRIGAGVGLAGELGAGAFGIASGISQGGVKGGLTAAGSAAGVTGAIVSNVSKLLGAASPALSAIPLVGSIMAAALPMIGSLFGTGPQKRQNELNTALSQNQFLAPTALNVTQSPDGTFSDFDARGNLRTSTLGALPTVAEPYITSRRLNLGDPRSYYDAPGSVTSPFSGGVTGTGKAPIANNGGTTIIVQGDLHAMDAASFHDFLQRNHGAVGEATATHLQTTEGRLSNEIRRVV